MQNLLKINLLYHIFGLFLLILLTQPKSTQAQIVSVNQINNSLGEQKTLVILFNFQNDPNNKPFTIAEINETIFTGPQSVNTFYYENSNGNTWFTGTVVGWYTVPFDDSQCSNTYSGANSAEDVARADGIPVDNFPRRVYIYPRVASCGDTGGTATTGGNPSKAYINGNLTLHLLTHEIGHNLTFGHSNALNCGSKAINYYSYCQIDYSDDPTSVMGVAPNYHHHAFHKSTVGWLSPSQITEVTESGEYILQSLTTNSVGLKTLKIRKNHTKYNGDEFYYVEYRQPTQDTFDFLLPPAITEGALIYIGYFNTSTNPDFSDASDLYLIDNTPESISGYYDASLVDGQSFHDEIDNITISQIAHNENSVTLSINLPSPSYTTTDLRNLLNKYLSIQDAFYGLVDQKVNMFDAAYRIRLIN